MDHGAGDAGTWVCAEVAASRFLYPFGNDSTRLNAEARRAGVLWAAVDRDADALAFTKAQLTDDVDRDEEPRGLERSVDFPCEIRAAERRAHRFSRAQPKLF